MRHSTTRWVTGHVVGPTLTFRGVRVSGAGQVFFVPTHRGRADYPAVVLPSRAASERRSPSRTTVSTILSPAW